MNFQPVKQQKVSEQVAEQIKSSILAGEFSPGEKLPPERKLAEYFGVSRPKVREGLEMLISAGLVISSHGGGTFVSTLLNSSQSL
jgi:GntR family transcriptional regulator, transcriptional repressor for pyruvate dehydrogenase complex